MASILKIESPVGGWRAEIAGWLSAPKPKWLKPKGHVGAIQDHEEQKDAIILRATHDLGIYEAWIQSLMGMLWVTTLKSPQNVRRKRYRKKVGFRRPGETNSQLRRNDRR